MNRVTSYKCNKNFHTTLINFMYQFKCDKNEIMAYSMLSRLLSKTNKIYNKEDIFLKERLNRYIISYSVSNQYINDVYFINFSLLIPNENILDDTDLKKQIYYLLDSIFLNNLDDEYLFNREKELLLESMLNNYKNIDFIAEKNLLDILDDDCVFNKIKYRDIKYIQSIKLEDVISFYNKYIRYTVPKIFVNGNIDINYLDSIIDEYLSNKNLKKNRVIKKYNNFYENKLSYNKRLDKCDFYQTIIYYVFTIKNYSEEDFYTLYLLNLMLTSSSSNLLLDSLRKRSNLVYTSGSTVMLKNGLLFIKAMTNKESISLVKIIINELLNDLKNTIKYKENINNIFRNYEINMEREKDNFFTNTNNIINKYYGIDISLDEELNMLKSIELDSICNLINRLDLVLEYTLEGEL